MQEWFKQNAWALIIAVTTIVSTFTLYGYRISALETRLDSTDGSVKSLQDTSVATQISLARIQTDIEYIRKQVDKIAN